MMAVAVEPGPTFNFQKPLTLFRSQYLHPPASPLSYDVASDGRFLLIKTVTARREPSATTVVLNWSAGRSN